jgi:Spy/CpxP family protein refolding chaperone
MMRSLWVLAGLAAYTSGAMAQGGPPAERLREQVVLRFMENYRTQSGLTDDQHAQLQTALRRSWEERRALQERERSLLRGVEGQMRPGVAADPDSVTRLLDGLVRVQADRAELSRNEQAQFAEFLTPVQRAQLVLALTRLEHQIEQILQGRREGMGPRRPR